MFFEIFSFPKVNQCAIITYEDGIHVFARGMPNDLRLPLTTIYVSLKSHRSDLSIDVKSYLFS